MIRKIFIVFISLFITTIYAQKDTTSIKLDEIIVNGIRANKTSPVSEKTITFDEISKSNVSFESSNFINRTPSVTMSTDNGTPFGYTYFRIRGIDQTRINMTLNGVPLNEPEDQGVFFSNMPSFMENIESLQVQRGVGTTSNGTASFGGSINFQTANYNEKGTSLKLDVGSFNTNRVTSTFSTGLKNKFALNIATSFYNTDGYRYQSGGTGTMFYINTGYFSNKSSIKITSILGNSINEMAWLAVSENDIKNDPRTNYNINNANDIFTQSLTILEYKNKFNEKVSLTSSVFYNKLVGAYDYNMMGNRDLKLNSDFYGIVNNLSVKLDKVSLDYGLSANDYTRKHNYEFNHFIDLNGDEEIDDTGFKVANNIGIKKEYATYLKIKLNFNKINIFYDTQIRHTIFNYRVNAISQFDGDIEKLNWTFVNPKGGLNIKIKPNSIFYYSVGLSYREPTRTALFGGLDYNISNININGIDIGNYTNINPESVLDHELGYKYFSESFTIKGNFFFMNYKNELIPVGGILPNGSPVLSQYDKSYRKGIELDLDIKISKNLILSNNQTLMTSNINNFSLINSDDIKIEYYNTQAILTPNYMSNTTITYSNKSYFISLFNRIQSKSYLDITNNYSIPSFMIFDMNIGYDKGKYMSMLTIGNLTNQKYYTNGSMTDQFFQQTTIRHLYVNSPINLFLTLKYKL
jgi:iron complex outermembrane receptor protein